MRIEAEKVSGNALVSDNPDVGFVVANESGTPLTPNNLTSKIPFRLDDSAQAQVGIRAWPVSMTGNKPAEGRFTSRGYLAWITNKEAICERDCCGGAAGSLAAQALRNALGEINIQLYGNIVDFTCVAEGSDSDKSVTLGTWPTKQLSTTGSRTQPAVYAEADRMPARRRVDYLFG
jgi:type 1 fimbria pilin